MKKMITLIFIVLIQSSFAINLAPRMQSLRCTGDMELQDRGYSEDGLLVEVNGQRQFLLDEVYFKDQGSMVLAMIDTRGWNLLSMTITEEMMTDQKIESQFGLIDGEEIPVYENGVQVSSTNCRVIWRRWD